MVIDNLSQAVYETVCSTLDNIGWTYERQDAQLKITCSVRGADLPINLMFLVDSDVQVVSVISPFPFYMDESKRVEAALAVSIANYGFINGSFDYDYRDGEIRFRIASSYRDGIPSTELITYMINLAAGNVEKYNDKFLMLSNGSIDLQQFADWENGN